MENTQRNGVQLADYTAIMAIKVISHWNNPISGMITPFTTIYSRLTGLNVWRLSGSARLRKDTNPLAKTFTFIFVTGFHLPEIFNIRPKRGVSTLKQKKRRWWLSFQKHWFRSIPALDLFYSSSVCVHQRSELTTSFLSTPSQCQLANSLTQLVLGWVDVTLW